MSTQYELFESPVSGAAQDPATNVFHLRLPSLSQLTPEQQAHVRGILKDFCLAFTEKYVKGQLEHGGNMWQKPGMLACLQDELLDHVAYLSTIEFQIHKTEPELHEYLTTPGEDDG